MLLAATWASCFHWSITLSATRILLCDFLVNGYNINLKRSYASVIAPRYLRSCSCGVYCFFPSG
ncbi:hypothetical protein PF005_g28030 [Phytophthora fragariae]|uniref:Uncharacterized protein n=1 Tax=Phytophthora fragariae TaxID=53985 RepID=A0A6A3Q5L1_9STRA|nr:hypothetical protein PF003_g6560 [Phytophthora fragariae]KAE8921200.1 hypothetical protein PF009_g28515 [Phytophthora fragariae]KAE9068796.1 hypothetical protein PF007_g27550 [Phytophthora fragariae]KAE9169300.1 hypothetical protein PF005_g28030 [Phytophthora fragariae]KAE9176068.1 hypothetical protein PF002_g28630 [Phytophthora fragariae]